MSAPALSAAQTLPRAHRCDATIGRTPTAFGFDPVICTQTVGVATFISVSGLRVGYCPIEGHEASVRRRFAERVDSPSVAEHEGHDEAPDPDCAICRKALDSFLRFGAAL